MLLGTFLSLQAQQQQKEVLLVDYFTHSSGNSSYTKMLRDAILAGIQRTSRLSVVDVDMEPTLKLEEKRRQSEKAMEDPLARNETMRLLGATYALTGHLTRIEGVKVRLENGSTYYEGQITFTLKVVHIADGSIKASKTFTYTGLNAKTGKTPQEAIMNTTDYIKMSMQNFVNQNFKIYTRLIAIEKTGRKGAETVYIDGGSDRGISQGQLFDVFVEKEVAGRKIKQNIGSLKALEIQGEDLTLCRVTKGGEAIRKANEEQREILVVSGKKTFNLWEATKDVMK